MACKRKEKDDKTGFDIHHLQTALVTAVTTVFSQLEKPTSSKKPEPEVSSDDDFVEKKPLLKRPLPSAFGKRVRAVGSKLPAKRQKLFVYERDIICLPRTHQISEGKVAIPRKNETRDMLASNGLIGKIRIDSSMSEVEIFDEIRSVFRKPMDNNSDFCFHILQHTGGGSKSLVIPSVSDSYSWTASAVVGRNSKTPIYILAEDDLKLVSNDENYYECTDKNDSSINTASTSTSTVINDSENYYSAYISLIDSSDEDDNNKLSPSPPPPPMSPLTPTGSEVLSPEDLLKSLQSEILSKESVVRLTFRRHHILEDSFTAFRKGFDFTSCLRITFLGEPAVDAGGPCREYFRLLISAIMSNNTFFEGAEDSRVPAHNMLELGRKTFKYLGQMIATSIVHGGPGPQCLSEAVVDYICFGMDKVHGKIADIPDPTVKDKVEKLEDVDDTQMFRQMLDSDEYEFRYDCGIVQPGTCYCLNNKSELIRMVAIHHSVIRVKAELDDLKEGLSCLSVLSLMQNHPNVMRELFVSCRHTLIANTLQDLFYISFSPRGSNSREKEEEVAMFFINFLHDIEDSNGNIEIDNQHFNMKLADILIFVTGAAVVPPMGFSPNPSIHFHENSPFPEANTCSNILRLSLLTTTYENFKYSICFGITNAVGFGHV